MVCWPLCPHLFLQFGRLSGRPIWPIHRVPKSCQIEWREELLTIRHCILALSVPAKIDNYVLHCSLYMPLLKLIKAYYRRLTSDCDFVVRVLIVIVVPEGKQIGLSWNLTIWIDMYSNLTIQLLPKLYINLIRRHLKSDPFNLTFSQLKQNLLPVMELKSLSPNRPPSSNPANYQTRPAPSYHLPRSVSE